MMMKLSAFFENEAPDSPDARLEAHVRNTLAVRKRRNGIFRMALFSDQAWDLILLLAIAPAEGSTLSELALASERAEALTHRWLGVLVEEDLATGSPEDRYRLTASAREMLRLVLL